MGPPPIFVRVVVAPAFIRESMKPALEQSGRIALLSVVGAIGLTFLFSAFAFLPLGRLRRQLDLLAAENTSPRRPSANPTTRSPSWPPK